MGERRSQRSARPFDGGAGAPLFFFRSPKNEESRAPAGAGAERRTRWPPSRSSRSPDRRRSPAGYAHRRAFRRSAAAFSLRRRAALSAALFAPPSASSWQEAVVPPGGAPTPPGSTAANRARGRRSIPRPGIAGRRLPEDEAESPAPLVRTAP